MVQGCLPVLNHLYSQQFSFLFTKLDLRHIAAQKDGINQPLRHEEGNSRVIGSVLPISHSLDRKLCLVNLHNTGQRMGWREYCGRGKLDTQSGGRDEGMQGEAWRHGEASREQRKGCWDVLQSSPYIPELWKIKIRDLSSQRLLGCGSVSFA